MYLKELMLRNIGGYDFIYATAICLPITCYAVMHNNGWKRAGFMALCAGQLVMVALSQYTYALFFSAAVVGLELTAALIRFLSKKIRGSALSTANSLILASVPFVILYLLRVPLVSWAVSFCEGIGFTSLSHSFQMLLDSFTGNAMDSTSRLAFYRLPIQGFLESPLIGSLAGGAPLISHHSDILDLLSGVGLIGAAVVSLMIAWIGRGLLRGCSKSTALPHLALQGLVLLACAALGTVTYSREIPLIFCAGMLLIQPISRTKTSIAS